MAQAVSHQLLTAEARVRSRVSPYEIFGKVALWQGFSACFGVSVYSISIPSVAHVHVHIAGNRVTNGWRLGTFQKATFFIKMGALDRKILPLSSLLGRTWCDVHVTLSCAFCRQREREWEWGGRGKNTKLYVMVVQTWLTHSLTCC